jgi:hypothetical protein
MALKANVAGTIAIGTLNVPIETSLPPPTPGKFVFDYAAADPAHPDSVIEVGVFIGWAGTELGLGVKTSDLPTSLQTLSIAIDKLHLDTDGNIDIKVELGTLTGTTWDGSWTPISSLSTFKLVGLTMEVTLTP